MTNSSKTLTAKLVIHFAPPILDMRGKKHPTQKDADQANEIYRLQDQLDELRAVPGTLVKQTPVPPRRRGRSRETAAAQAEAMACEILLRNNGIGYTEAARRAVDECFPHENEVKRDGRVNTLRRRLSGRASES